MCAEMVSASALKFNNEKSLNMLKIDKDEHPLSMQIFGGEADDIAAAAKLAQAQGADIIDINAGCPVKKVNKAGAGCVLMKDPDKIGRMVAAAVKAVKVPITLKTRISLNRSEILGPLIAKIAQDNGAAAVVIHARAAADFHNGPPNLAALEACVKAVNIPIIGNGGVADAAAAKAMFNCGCQGVMIGRGAVGNPFIFRDITAQLSGQTNAPLTAAQKLQLYLSLVIKNAQIYGGRTGVNRSKKTVGYWVKGFAGSSAIREKLVRSESLEETRSILTDAINSKI